MSIVEKIKALWAVRAIWATVSEAKKASGFASIKFWLAIVGGLVTLVGSIQGLIPATIAAIIIAALGIIYKLLRGAENAEQSGVDKWYASSGFVIFILTTLAEGVNQLQTVGISAPFMASIGTALVAALGAYRSMSKEQPGNHVE